MPNAAQYMSWKCLSFDKYPVAFSLTDARRLAFSVLASLALLFFHGFRAKNKDIMMMGRKPPELDSDFVEVDPTGRYGRYNEILGKGASKTVYKAFDEFEGIEVAWNQVKLYDFLQSPEDLERLYCEIHLLKTLKHKNIMKFYTSWVDTANRNINFITEMFTSGTLKQYRQKHKRVNLRAVKHWCRQILKGLLYLHSHDPPVIHRDLKCDNIFVNGNHGEVKIGDLGLAAILRKSYAAHCVGTPEFMAPEVYAEDYNELVDVYSFGMCVLEMVTFEYPYSECTHPAQIYKKVVSGKKPEALYKVKDPEVRQFVEKCLATVSLRLPARELLKDPFLQTEDFSYEPELLECQRETNEIGHLLRQPTLVEPYHDCSSLINGYYDHLSLESEDGWDYDYDVAEDEHLGIDFFTGQEDEPSRNVTIKGKRRDDNHIFLRLRIADKEGRIRNIYFPFDMETDTALTVATEMVAELDITDQDVTKIAEMIDGEISSLVPEWKPGPGIEEAPSLPLCHRCASNVSSVGSLLNYLSSNNPDGKNLQGIHCSRIGCASMHGRFEEVTYQIDGSEHCATDGAPISNQSNGLECTDIWVRHDGPDLGLEGSAQIHCDEESLQLDQSTSRKDENLLVTDNHLDHRDRKSVDPAIYSPTDHQSSGITELGGGSSPTIHFSTYASSEDYENEMRQEFRWLKAKHDMELKDLSTQPFGRTQKILGPSPSSGYRNDRIENGVMGASVLTPLQGQNKHLATGNSFSFYFLSHNRRNLAPMNSCCPDSETQRARHCEATNLCGPENNAFTAKNFYTGALLRQSLHRSKSLPVDAVDV